MDRNRTEMDVGRLGVRESGNPAASQLQGGLSSAPM